MHDTKRAILSILMKIYADPCTSGLIVSCPTIAKHSGISIHSVRYHMRQLRDRGFVKSDSNLYEDFALPYRGFVITRKATRMKMYRDIDEKITKIFNECFGITDEGIS